MILSIQTFQIVMQVHRILARLFNIVERCAAQRHCGNTALIWLCPLSIRSLFSSPDFRSRGRPSVGNVFSVFGRNAQIRHFVPRIRSSEPISRPCAFEELNLVGISRIVDIHNRRSVTGNHCVLICSVCLLCIPSKTIIIFLNFIQINLASGYAGRSTVLMIGIVIVIRIFPPINDSILSVTICFPNRMKRSIFFNRAAEFIFRTVFRSRPIFKGIARSRRCFRFYCILSCRNEYRLHIACSFAAGEVQIMARFDLRIKRDVMIRKCNRLDFMGQFSFCVPAGNGVCGIQRNRYIRHFDYGSASSFLRSAYSVLLVKEEDIICLLENRIQTDVSCCAYRCCQCAEIAWISFLNGRNVLRIGPPKELASRFFRCCRRINRFAVLHLLRRNHLSIRVIEEICSDRWIIRSRDDINRKLARLKARSLCRSICDLACVAAVIDVQYLMAVTTHIS